ncbi:bifunctional hydroxymethylpyrimidine kinase/phosphomethylpyrimidine kinase [Caldimonas brevitalea]|uniref:hydroxymethylpyrimidine kinase n=1 Tax=Caldimonas brevitalea TaxID=413882 RepID=A0A0G3BNI9_9BURK|nr:bifunctional hydroxymethylpyrimidine kinase/phosphomethylpyrimidine kinase [Caldimonas brevitalea]AKJ29558.1 hydroxymethylpyrimidine kinase / phosphomethylpyrimidine kinase / thiamine-phosphate diphosphorylase [Caldimonas brevitalea]
MNVPIVWSVAGSDSGCGAGVQADLKAFEAFDVHGCTAIAALTAQNSTTVSRIEAVSPEMLDAQLAVLALDLPPAAIKTGMLGSAEHVQRLVRWLDKLRSRRPVALVVDPVWRASIGASLSAESLRQAILTELLPRASVITPNRREAAWLLDAPELRQDADVPAAAAALRRLGPAAVVITGGDASREQSLDWLATVQAQGWLGLPRVPTSHHHGTGCVFASSVASALALGFCEADAIVLGKMATTVALQHGYAAGQGAGPVRPRRGFGLHPDALPRLHATWSAPPQRPFAPLQQRRLGLYPVVDSADWVARLLKVGVRTLQLRIKDMPRPQLSDEIRRSVLLARAAGAQLFVNDHWALALEHGAYGVHLGQEDLQSVPAEALESLRAAGLRLGLSTHSYWEVCRARAFGPSYIACGPIHATTTKDMPWWPQGAGNLAYWCSLLREPVVAIGGMDEARSLEATRCGAAGVAVVRGIVQAGAPEAAAQRLMRSIEEGERAEPLAPPALPRSTLAGPVPPPLPLPIH